MTTDYAFGWLDAAAIVAALAGLLHVYIWAMESLVFQTKGRKVFGLTAEQASDPRVRQLFFNQGFYNLFLGLGALVGAALTLCDGCVAGRTLLWFTTASMLGAAVVLVADDRKMLRGGVVQGTLPLVALVLLTVAALA